MNNPQEVTLVTFRLDKEIFGVPILQVREVIPLCDIIFVPNAPAFIEGIINLRGNAVCVMDLRKRFHMNPIPPDNAKRIMIMDVHGRTMGLIVDQVLEVLRLSDSLIDPIPSEMNTPRNRFLKGIGKSGNPFTLILDLEKMFSTEELLKLDQESQGGK